MDDHAAFIAHLLAFHHVAFESRDILIGHERGVDGDDAGGAGGDGHLGAAPHLFDGFGGQLHAHVAAVVHGAEDGVHVAGTGHAAFIGVHDALGGFEQHGDLHGPDRDTAAAFQFFELPVKTLDVIRMAGLGEGYAVKAFPHDGFEVVVGHFGFPVVDADVHLSAAGTGVFKLFGNELAGRFLFGRGHGVFEVEGNDVGGDAGSFFNHLGVIAGNIHDGTHNGHGNSPLRKKVG